MNCSVCGEPVEEWHRAVFADDGTVVHEECDDLPSQVESLFDDYEQDEP